MSDEKQKLRVAPKVTICPPMPAQGAYFDSPFSIFPTALSKRMQWPRDYTERLTEEESFD
jgi:hypothetical protein